MREATSNVIWRDRDYDRVIRAGDEKYFSPTPGDSDIGTGAEAGAVDVVSPVAHEMQDP